MTDEIDTFHSILVTHTWSLSQGIAGAGESPMAVPVSQMHRTIANQTLGLLSADHPGYYEETDLDRLARLLEYGIPEDHRARLQLSLRLANALGYIQARHTTYKEEQS